jgi:uncharacterized protein
MTIGPGQERRRPIGTFGQLVIFMLIWAVLVTVLGVLAILPALYAAYIETGTIAFPSGDGGAGLGATSPTTLLVAASSALATALAIWLAHRFLGTPSLLDLGLRPRPGWQTDVLLGLLAGPLMFAVILLVLVGVVWAQVGPGVIDGRGLLIAFVTYVLVAFSEEALSRGWILQVLERGYGGTTAVLGSAVLFAVLHAFNPGFGLPALLGLFLAGVLFAQAYLVTRKLWLPMAFHLSWNFSEGPLYGFPVSGLPGEGLLTVTPTGPDVVTGGAFGPEAGLILIVGMVPAALLLVAIGRWRRPGPTPRP